MTKRNAATRALCLFLLAALVPSQSSLVLAQTSLDESSSLVPEPSSSAPEPSSLVPEPSSSVPEPSSSVPAPANSTTTTPTPTSSLGPPPETTPTASTLPPPGQPTQSGITNQFQIIAKTGVSAQQLFLGTEETIYVVDKTENNYLQVAKHPAWASEITLSTSAIRAMNVVTNSFCAGGNFLGDGRMLNVGGNQGITTDGATPSGVDTPAANGGAPYFDLDGGQAIRILTPCSNGSCQWIDSPKNYMTTRRWYPTVETLPDGSVIILGGDTTGGYVNDDNQNNPTYEFWPEQGSPQTLTILENTLPANLYPLTWLLPSGLLFIQTGWEAETFDYNSGIETNFPNIPGAIRTYPASGASVMLPLTPANNYTATLLFCGGQNLQGYQFDPDQYNIAAYQASTSCVTIQPDISTKWTKAAPLPEGRTMGNFVFLPDGTIFLANGGRLGTAGYGTEDWTIGDSYATSPILSPLIYDPSTGAFSRAGLGNSTIPRLYHSTAITLPDGSVIIAGSNPHPDVVLDTTYPTEYRYERYYPSYYNEARPSPGGLLASIGYGGSYFNVSLSATDLQNNADGVINNTKVIILRTGFSTHAINMGQRYVELESTYTLDEAAGSAILHVSQLPPNPNVLAPGPAVIHVVVDGIPSVGKIIMIGDGVIGNQTVSDVVPLPASGVIKPADTGNGGNGGNGSGGKGAPKVDKGAADARVRGAIGVVVVSVVMSVLLGASSAL